MCVPRLEVQYRRPLHGPAQRAAVVGGSLEAGKVGSMAAISAHARGLPFKAIAPVSGWNSETPIRGVVVAVSAPLRSAKDFSGKVIAVSSLGDLDTLATEAWIDRNRGDPKSVKFVELSPTAIPAAIDQGRVDGGVLGDLGEPLLSAATETKKYRLAIPSDDAIGKHWDLAVVVAGDDWTSKNRALVERFIRVIHDANVHVAADESKAAPLIAKFIGLDPSQATQISHPVRVPYLTPDGLQPPIDAAAKYNLIPQVFPASEMISPIVLKPPAV